MVPPMSPRLLLTVSLECLSDSHCTTQREIGDEGVHLQGRGCSLRSTLSEGMKSVQEIPPSLAIKTI